MTEHTTSILATALAIALSTTGCDSNEEEATAPATATEIAGELAPQAEAEAEEAQEAEEAGGPPVLAEADIPNIGAMQMPRGYTTTQETAAGGNYAYDLGNYESLLVSWESGEAAGAADLDGARRAAGYMAGGEVTEAQTLENGMHEVIKLREHDQRSFVLVISANRYVNCNGPTAHLETLRAICQSAPVPAN